MHGLGTYRLPSLGVERESVLILEVDFACGATYRSGVNWWGTGMEPHMSDRPRHVVSDEELGVETRRVFESEKPRGKLIRQ